MKYVDGSNDWASWLGYDQWQDSSMCKTILLTGISMFMNIMILWYL
jgi:hypothetical protein